MDNGKVIYGPVPITSGRPGHLTPTGTFRVQFKDINHKSHEFNDAPMPYSVFFNSGIAFHQGSLKVKSHGCIHLSAAAAKMYFDSLQVGAVVEVVR
jgi:lipoprotein-anchoring transpeptidase ErfK/SrfK